MTYRFDTDIQAACQIATLGEIYEKYIGYKTDGFFVEIGAFDGYSWSNTLPLIEAGWRGIMVEPEPRALDLLRNRHGSNPKIQVVSGAVAAISGTTRLYPGGSISTTIKEMVDVFRKEPNIALSGLDEGNFIEVNCWCMDDLLRFYKCPGKFDLISIDVEGAEWGVLQGYHIDQFRPKMAIVEMVEASGSHYLQFIAKKVREYFGDNGYQKIYYDGMNAIFVDKRL